MSILFSIIKNLFRAIFLFSLFFCIAFWDYINHEVYNYFYSNFEKNFKKDKKIVAIYFSINTFEKMQRRYVKEFYFLEKFLHLCNINYIILNDKNIHNTLDKDIDLLIVNDCRFIPISTILKIQEYSKYGKVLFTYQSLMFNQFEKKYHPHLYEQFGLYEIKFSNRIYDYFTYKHFTKINLSRKYCVEYYTDQMNVLALTSNKTPFIVNFQNYYFIAENTFTVENIFNPLIFQFNIYLLNQIVPGLINITPQNQIQKIKKIEIIMPIEYISNHPKTKRYFLVSRKMKEILDQIQNLKQLDTQKNKKIKINITKINPQKFQYKDLVNYYQNKFLLLIKLNSQNGIEEYFTYRINTIISLDPFIIECNLEDYLISVVISEIPDDFGLEAMKAQAIAARTYAIKNSNRHINFDLCDKPHCQNFEGEKLETFKSYIATKSTNTKIITYKGKPIDAVYHSTCGGITANSEDVWNTYLPYLRSTKDYETNIDQAFCKQSKLFKWQVKIEINKLQKILHKTVPYLTNKQFHGKIKSIKIYKNKSQRIEKLIIETTLDKYEVHKDDSIYLFSEDLYFSLLPSNFIEKIELNSKEIIFYGRGFGHGVGMCQFGANYLSSLKYNYEQILKHYYKNIKIDNY